MDLEDVKSSLRPDRRDRVDDWFAEFRSGNDSDDVDHFIGWLHESGRISPETFRGLHAGGKLVLTHFETLAEGATYFPDDPAELSDDRVDFDHEPEEEPTDEGRGPQYAFLGKLAEGAMGEIHIVRERDLQRKVALKRMHAHIAAKPKLARRFLNEAQITAQLDHPNIVPVYAIGGSGGVAHSYTMKLVRGRTFEALIQDTRAAYDAGGELDIEHQLSTRLDHFCRACDALSYAHSRGVVHRDLKPENIMVGEYGEVYVMDWGIARIMETPEEEVEELEDFVALGGTQIHKTRFGAVLGTPAFMSPEQAAGKNESLDGRSDGFSLGLILFELVSLRPAVTGHDTMQILERMMAAELDPLRHHVRSEVIDPPLAAIIDKATRLQPSMRYPSVRALADDVRAYMRGEPVTALDEGPLQRMYRFIARHREIVLTSVLVGFSIFGAISIGSLASTLITVRSASVREAQLSNVLSEVSRQAHTIDNRFHAYQALLKVVTASTVEALRTTPEYKEEPDFFVKDAAPFGLTPRMQDRFVERFAPDDLAPAPVYGENVALSFSYPNTLIARGEPGTRTTDIANALSMLRRPLKRVIVESHDAGMVTLDPIAAEQLLRTEVSPVQWVYVGLESGVGVSYPGHDGVAPGIDVRKEPWYTSLEGSHGAVWGNPHLDATGAQTLFPVSMGIFGDDGAFIGVAAVEVSFRYISDNLLKMDAFPGSEAYILDEDGRVIMSTVQDQRERSSNSVLKSRWQRRKRLENAEIREAVRTRVGGTLQVSGPDGRSDLAVWSRMGDLGWTYLVQGPVDVLMEES